MKKVRMIISSLVCAAFLIVITLIGYVPTDAATINTSTYVALGDSITTGYGLANFNKNDVKNKLSANNFVNKLSRRLGKKAVNLGVEGIDSMRLLEGIIKPKTTEQKTAIAEIKKASIITLSIGGNNVLQPLIAALNGALKEGKTIYNSSADEVQNAALNLLFNKSSMDKLMAATQEGALKFKGDTNLKTVGDFYNIISTIKKLNPKAQIIVQTIYNPYKTVLPIVDNTIMLMNEKIIKDSANGKNFKVADVYSAFSKASTGTVLINADTNVSFDPHPTAKGHNVIYTLIAYAAQNNILPYNVKAAITNGKLITKVSEGELLITITPVKGYKVPKSISVTVGKGTKKTLTLNKGIVSIPVADVGADIIVTGVCSK